MILKSVAEHTKGVTDFWGLKPDMQGWGSDHPEFEAFVRSVPSPKMIVELGCWKGQGTLKLAQLCPEAIVVAVDTWLASLEHMGESGNRPPMANGFPLLWWQMLTNLADKPEAPRIFPLAQTTRTASRLVGTLPFKPDIVVVDADHQWGGPYDDISRYWPLLRSGGLMFGDDYGDPTFPAVTAEATRFAWEQGLHLEIKGRFWGLRKP